MNFLTYKPWNSRLLKVSLAIVYLTGLTYLTFFARRRRHSYKHEKILDPFQGIRDYKLIDDIGTFNYLSNILGNIILFIPLPFVLISIFKIHKFSTVLFLSLLLSFTIELLQYVFEVGVADIDDIILNGLGAVTGYYFYEFSRTRLN